MSQCPSTTTKESWRPCPTGRTPLPRVVVEVGDGLSAPCVYFSGVAQYDPLQVAAELSVRATTHLLLTAQACWKNWSAYVYPIDKSTDGSLPLPVPHFHDTVVPRVALEWQDASAWRDRGGFVANGNLV